jgi:ribosome biogenesis GTPase / thiamine phosphate phosphatase
VPASAPSLTSLGRNERVPDFHAHGLIAGRVTQIDRSSVTVTAETGLLRVPNVVPEVVCGDWVGVSPSEPRVILQVAPRWSLLQRASAGGSSSPQLLAANVDVTLVVIGLDHDLNLRRLHRLLTIAWSSGSSPVVIATKADVVEEDGPMLEQTEAMLGRDAAGAQVVVTSVRTGRGLDRLREFVPSGTTAVLLGQSGAGKTSLVNALTGRGLEVGGVREHDHKGRHTTRSLSLVPIPGGGVLLDTPGLRGVGLSAGEADGLSAAFSDISALALQCRFRDCAHRTEPGCAVLSAVEVGALGADRLESFHKLADERARATRRADARRGRADSRREGRAFKRFKEQQGRLRGP